MDKIWLNSYPEGVPADINPDAYSSLVGVYEESFKKYGNKPAYANMGSTMTYAELDTLTQAFASYLTNVLNLKKGDRMAIMLPNLLQYPVALIGAHRAGLVVVNVNPLYTHRELEHQLTDAGVETVVVLKNFASVLEQALPNTKVRNVIVTDIGDLFSPFKSIIVNFIVKYIKKMVPAWTIPHAINFKDVIKEGKNLSFNAIEMNGEDIAFLQYTGGTTGVAKGAVLTHRNLVANLEQASAWMMVRVKEGEEIIITALPLYHVFSLTANCMVSLKIGALNVLITNPRDMNGFVKELTKYKFSVITGVNTLFNGLLNNPNFASVDFSALKISLGGGMATQEAVATHWQEVTGHPLLDAYGLTETSPAVTINPLTLNAFNGTIGLPVPSTEVTIRDDDGNVLPVGEAGELCVKGPQVMREYWNCPEETNKVFFDAGVLRTGDIASIDDKGFVKILERKKDMVVVSGFNVYPNEVEGVIATHPGVLEVAVIGVPHPQTGEAVKAFIVKKDESLTEDEIRKFCRETLTAYKVPKQVEFRDELPKSNVGKILRRALRE